jgi:hypothetical protein
VVIILLNFHGLNVVIHLENLPYGVVSSIALLEHFVKNVEEKAGF